MMRCWDVDTITRINFKGIVTELNEMVDDGCIIDNPSISKPEDDDYIIDNPSESIDDHYIIDNPSASKANDYANA